MGLFDSVRRSTVTARREGTLALEQINQEGLTCINGRIHLKNKRGNL